MKRFRTRNKLATGYLLLALLLAPVAAAAHAWQHDPGTPQGQACAACASAGQLGSACVDSVQIPLVLPGFLCPIDARTFQGASIEPLGFLSRAPPIAR